MTSLKSLSLFIICVGGVVAAAHGSESHSGASAPLTSETVFMAAQAYQKDVAPIFKNKCYDCHGVVDKLPWYYAVPGVKQLMDYDIREAKEHLDMSNGYPFQGHGEPAKDLKEIEEVIAEGEMPIWYYRLVHWDSKLTDIEVEIVKNWIKGIRFEATRGIPGEGGDSYHHGN